MSFEKFNKQEKSDKSTFDRDSHDSTTINSVVNKLKILYNKFQLNKNEKKRNTMERQMSDFDVSVNKLDQSKKDIEIVIDDYKKKNISGIESLQLESRIIDKQKTAILNKKNNVQNKIEIRESKVKYYANEKNRITDKLINYYNEKLKPIEDELEVLKDNKKYIDTEVATFEANNIKMISNIDKLEQQKSNIEENMRNFNTKEQTIKSSVKKLEKIIKKERTHISIKTSQFTKRINNLNIDKEITRAETQVNLYKNKKNELVHIKQNTIPDINSESKNGDKYDGSKKEWTEEPKTEKEKTVKREEQENKSNKENLSTVSSHVSEWNTYLSNKYRGEKKNLSIDPGILSKEIMNRMNSKTEQKDYEDLKISFKSFKEILEEYYYHKEMREDLSKDISIDIDLFEKKSIK